MDGGVEECAAAGVPFDIDDAVAKARLELGGYRTVAAVHLNMVFVVDEAKCIVAGDGTATGWENQAAQVLIGEDKGFLAVEILRYRDEFGRAVFLLLFFACCWFAGLFVVVAEEGNVFAPTTPFFLLS